MIFSVDESHQSPQDNDQAEDTEKTQDNEDYNYLDHLRWVTNNYYAIHCDYDPPKSALQVPTLKRLHKSMMEINNPNVTAKEIADAWNLRLPNIPWGMD